MGPSDVGAIRPEITEAWRNIPGKFDSFVTALTPEKVCFLLDEASKTFMERSGLSQLNQHILISLCKTTKRNWSLLHPYEC